ncbi:MAG: acyltransferase [Gammaproteobacteria bacterium]|nr:acyltransferase [Gammaproteobacteria bacterium]MYF53978.1 acyltransferase [Gammaproteobacteria bacterium]MYK43664.1 acyltransferase [Gammaproteobacteria bacterium]
MTDGTTYSGASTKTKRHIVDVLIEERAVNLMRHPALWRVIKALSYRILGYDRAVQMADTIAPLRGKETFQYMSNLLQLQLSVTGKQYIPASGAAIVTPNHPAGIADGIAVWDAIKEIRQDIIFVANRDAIRASPGLADIIIPVEWRDEFRSPKRNRETIRALQQAIKDERLIVIFPSGKLALPSFFGLVEQPWQITALQLAQKYELDVIPIHIKGHNTFFFYAVSYINNELRDMSLFRELLNKSGQSYQLTIGEPTRVEGNVTETTKKLQNFVLKDLGSGKTAFSDNT